MTAAVVGFVPLLIGVVDASFHLSWSLWVQAPIALAYLHRDYRASGRQLEMEVDGVSYRATVVVLPFYQAPDREQQSRTLAEMGMRAFAENREEEAMRIEEVKEAASQGEEARQDEARRSHFHRD